MLKFKNIQSIDIIDKNIYAHNHLVFYGNTNLDDRGKKAYEIVSKIQDSVQIEYDPLTFSMQINSNTVPYKDFLTYIQSVTTTRILIEATTLSFAEILYILEGANQNDKVIEIQILYIEPKEYKFHNSSVTTYDEFSLSDKFQQYPPLPGYTINAELNDIDLIAFLGFEKTRLGQIFAQEETVYQNFTPIIPLPGFLPGWENRSINNHLKFFSSKYSFSDIKYVAANNPYQAYTVLEKIANSQKNFRVAPIGTKPNAIGCAVFLVNYANEEANYGALYDFPVKSKKRSEGIGKIHIYNLFKE
ncbi:hypothetical protein LCX93_09770 [Sulfurimonas sp. SWIR-19]|uniref:hypothetical protein n=1 Tax=Sulfurimonas sp. SWIR-19 TaxID=2878390 RepID=UPI001CF219F1|nr:hypothetical protein [Sulfurimonas sp. SWIR-19]UCM99807.1 hypothetical protein LCX93_09770 [Sulfurimonas sp. SWIR-19]